MRVLLSFSHLEFSFIGALDRSYVYDEATLAIEGLWIWELVWYINRAMALNG
jgi:hypothetical protein